MKCNSMCAAKSNLHKAFSLVELSIVLVILGLLVGGVLSGRSLIRAAELRKITTGYDSYTTAVNQFRDRYFFLPGDLPNATSFWSAQTSTACPNSGTGNFNERTTCNGNGNGEIGGNTYATDNADAELHETMRAWNHLFRAGLVEGAYSGLGYNTAGTDIYASSYKTLATTSPNAPSAGLVSSSCWNMRYMRQTANFSHIRWGSFFPLTGNYLLVGGGNSAEINMCTTGMLLEPADAYNIDTKLDDGKPGLGKVTSGNEATCTNTTIAASAAYLLSSNTTGCTLRFFLAP